MKEEPIENHGFVRFVYGCWCKCRRFVNVKFRPAYVRASLEKRKGECQRCGRCCSIGFRCPHLTDNNVCQRYETRYEQCMRFPIDRSDLHYLGDKCGFYFDDEDK
jgi:hypothetical protein